MTFKTILAILLLMLSIGRRAVCQTPPVWTDFVEATAQGKQPILPDYSFAGCYFSEKQIPDISDHRYFNVMDYGAIPNDTIHDDSAIQATIQAAVELGMPSIVFFPAGRYWVSNDHDIDKSIHIQGNNIVLKGEGSGNGGTELYMDKMRVNNGHWQFKFHPKEYNTSTITTITKEVKRGAFTVSVASSSSLHVGQTIVIYHQSEAFARAHYGELPLNETAWSRLFGDNGGMTFYECHIIEAINGNEVTFKNPVQTDLPKLQESFAIRNLQTIESVGIEDIRFTSGWGTHHADFVHHANDTVDYGWNAVQFKFVKNSWIRNCEFKDWTQVCDIRESIGVTVENVVLTGKRGHASWVTRRNYGVLVKDCVDEANHHHGPGVGYSGVCTVYLRYKMSQNQAIDCHSGSPITTLMDDVDGGDFHTNGGPWESYPHHGRYLTFWNFVHKKSVNAMYDFWSVDVRKPATYAEPYFIGFQPNHLVTFTGAGLDQMRGVKVVPQSLFEAQLALRLKTNTLPHTQASQENKVTIAPNPFNQDIKIFGVDDSAILDVSLFGIDGKQYHGNLKYSSTGCTFTPSTLLEPGMYLIRVYTVNGLCHILKGYKM